MLNYPQPPNESGTIHTIPHHTKGKISTQSRPNSYKLVFDVLFRSTISSVSGCCCYWYCFFCICFGSCACLYFVSVFFVLSLETLQVIHLVYHNKGFSAFMKSGNKLFFLRFSFHVYFHWKNFHQDHLCCFCGQRKKKNLNTFSKEQLSSCVYRSLWNETANSDELFFVTQHDKKDKKEIVKF